MIGRFWIAASVLACGCGRINFDPLGGGDGGTGGDGKVGDGKVGDGNGIDATGPGTACVPGTPPNCPVSGHLLNLLGTTTDSGPSANRGDGLSGSCGGAGADEVTIQFQASQSGTFIFTTIGSDYDTVLYIRDSTCTGPELACNDNFSSGFTSQVTLSLTSGQTVIAVVDGANGLCGNFSLRAGVNP